MNPASEIVIYLISAFLLFPNFHGSSLSLPLPLPLYHSHTFLLSISISFSLSITFSLSHSFSFSLSIPLSFSGSWNTPRSGFSHPAKGNADGKVLYSIVVVGDGRGGSQMWNNAVSFFTKSLQSDGQNAGLRLEQVGRSESISTNNISRSSEFGGILSKFKSMEARIVFVVMIDECYADVKYWADSHG